MALCILSLPSSVLVLLLLLMIIRRNLPFNLLSSQEFREALSATLRLRKEVRVGGRTFMSTTLISRIKNKLMNQITRLLQDSVPGLCEVGLRLSSSHDSCSSGSLCLDGWKSKYQKSHVFGGRFTFVSPKWQLLNLVVCVILVCVWFAVIPSFQPD